MRRISEFEMQHPSEYYINLAKEGTKVSIDKIMEDINNKMTLTESKFAIAMSSLSAQK